MNLIGNLLILPFFSLKCKIHDTSLQTVFVALECIGFFVFTFSKELWQIYVSNGIIELFTSLKWALLRSITSKSVNSNEIGKMFSFYAILGSIVPFVANPGYRQLYNLTLDIFPSAILLLTASVFLLTIVLNGFMYWQKWRIDNFATESEEIQKEKEIVISSEFVISHM